MKIRIPLFAAAILFGATQCASIQRSSIKLNSKWNESFERPIKLVCFEAKFVDKQHEEMYEAVFEGFKQSLVEKGINIKEEFTPLASDGTEIPDAVLILGKPFKGLVQQGVYIPTQVGHFTQTTAVRQRLIIQLQDPVSKHDIWVGEVSFTTMDARYIGKKVVRQMVKTGLLAPEKME